jgi:peptidoglycan/xylan/chitin deacetylase (PgdA/CDA1 family)
MATMARSLPRSVLRPVVLVHHGVGEASDAQDPHRLVASLDRLERQVRLLLSAGYRFSTAEELLGLPQRSPGRGTAVLTFDDGFRSWLTLVAPLLRRMGVRATFYVCPGMWGVQHPLVEGEAGRLLEEHEAHALWEAGMELGSHTNSHPDLRGLDNAALATELRDSKAAVEALTGRPCRTHAYPYGLHDARVERAAAEAGYELAFAWLPGPWRRFGAPRLPAPTRHGAGRLALKLAGVRRRR